MTTNYAKIHEKEYDKLIIENETLQKENKRLKNIEKTLVSLSIKIDDLISTNKELTQTINNQNQQLKEKDESNRKKDELINRLTEENERLKNKNKKDSSNSSKPSSTNGSKIVSNNREKSTRSKGGQINHIAHTLKSKDVEEIIKNKSDVKLVKKVIKNLDKKYPKYVLDLVVNVLVTENTDCNIDKLNEVQYGDNIKSLVVLLATDCYMSYDRIVSFISALTNNTINLSKGTMVNWINEFSAGIKTEITAIENDLLKGHYIQVDDSNVKANGKNCYQLCVCNKQTVLLTGSETKNKEAWDTTIVSKYLNILIKDGTRVFDKYGLKQAQCNVHIARYLKGCYDLSNKKHKIPLEIRKFLNDINEHRKKLIELGVNTFTKEEIDGYYKKYDELIELWGTELEGESEIIYNEEIQLYNRMKEKDKEEILFFIKDFDIPFSNNNAEAMQRGIKIKQKIGKFRSFDGLNEYCRIKSFISTLRKRKLSIIDSIKKILANEPVLA